MVKKGSVNNLMIHLEWGGACGDYKTCGSILSGGTVITLNPSYSSLSSSATAGIFNNSNSNNPFRNWTHIFVPFGTGDIHIGNQAVKYTSGLSSRTVYHGGYLNAKVAMRWAKAQGTWGKVALTGSSAGGFGTILHSYTATQIFGAPIYTVNDSGPGLTAKEGSNFGNATDAGNRWGSWKNFPSGAITDQSAPLLNFVKYSMKSCPTCYYGLFETLQDSTIANFEGVSTTEHQAKLIATVKDVNSSINSQFGYYLPSGTSHTILTGSGFYSKTLNNTYLYNWVKNLINGTTADLSAVSVN